VDDRYDFLIFVMAEAHPLSEQAKSNPSEEDKVSTIISFNIGGKIFQTTLGNLSLQKDGLLYKSAKYHLDKDKFKLKYDSQGNLFIDRSYEHFPLILDFHRMGDQIKATLQQSYQDLQKLKL